MDSRVKSIDIESFFEDLNTELNEREYQTKLDIEKKQAFFSGYKEAVLDVKRWLRKREESMLYTGATLEAVMVACRMICIKLGVSGGYQEISSEGKTVSEITTEFAELIKIQLDIGGSNTV